MKPFKGKADDDIENALRRGYNVPDGAVNIAWVKAPTVSPKNNIVVVDTTRSVAQNQTSDIRKRRVAYANSLGILEDEEGNELWPEEYMVISDQFLNDSYDEESILPFLHSSRHLHLDVAGMGTPGDIVEYTGQSIKVVDEDGVDYVNAAGDQLYRVFIQQVVTATDDTTTDGAYRVLIYLDVPMGREDLYVTYSKCEVSKLGVIQNREYSYKEILNPRAYFCYRPEETDVIDHSGVKQNIYSSKPLGMKEQMLGVSEGNQAGWRIFVPRKAIADPRLFQTFQWRLKTEYIKSYKVDPSRRPKQIRAAFLVPASNTEPITGAYAFYNLINTGYNYANVDFINPLQTDHSKKNKLNPSYWKVDFDTVTTADMAKFDVLIVTANSTVFKLSDTAHHYLQKVKYFVETVGGTLIIDTANVGHVTGLGIKVSGPVNGNTGKYKAVEDGDTERPVNQGSLVSHSSNSVYAVGSTITVSDNTNKFIRGEAKYGGWNIDSGTDGLGTITPYRKSVTGFKYTQYIKEYPDDYTVIIEAEDNAATPNTVPLVIHKKFPSGGEIVYSSCGLIKSCSDIFTSVAPYKVIVTNVKKAFANDTNNNFADLYQRGIDSAFIEGAMKLLTNIVFESTTHKNADDSDEETYNSSYVKYTGWLPSWVIDASDDVLTDEEKSKYKFSLLPINTEDLTTTWQRTLSQRTVRQLAESVLTASQRIAVRGATRVYTIETTNPLVTTPESEYINDADLPRAWTTAYSPRLVIPDDFGPYVVRDELTKAEYAPGEFKVKSYPAKPFDFQISSNYVTGYEDGHVFSDINVIMYGTATKTLRTGSSPKPETTVVDVDLNWKEHGTGAYQESPYTGQFEIQRPVGMRTWQETNYSITNSNSATFNWPYWGAEQMISRSAKSKGAWVKFLQDALNTFVQRGLYQSALPALVVDGEFGDKTHAKVVEFQTSQNARWKTGVVDAETWSIVGHGIVKLRETLGHPENWTKYGKVAWAEPYVYPNRYIILDNISDGSNKFGYLKASWMGNDTNPSRISDAFKIAFSESYKVTGATLTPFVHENAKEKTIIWDWLHFGQFDVANFNVKKMTPGSLKYRVKDGTSRKVSINPITNIDVVGFGIAQDKPSGVGNSKIMGVKEFIVHAKKKVTRVVDAGAETTQSYPVTVMCVVPIKIIAGQIKMFKPTVTRVIDDVHPLEKGNISDIQWYSVTLSDHTDKIDPRYHHADGRVIPLTFGHNYRNSGGTDARGFSNNGKFSFRLTETALRGGRTITGTAYGHSSPASYKLMTPGGLVVPYSRTDGYISMHEGLKLLSDSDGKPVGFPDFAGTMDIDVNGDVHFAKIKLNKTGTSQHVKIGFYDSQDKEFIANAGGNITEMSYAEYMSRGKNNVYVAILCEYSTERSESLPEVTDAPNLPVTWVMPVYGVALESNAHIQVEPFSPNLNKTDIWPLPIRVGRFSRNVKIRPRSKGYLADELTIIQNETVTAVYSVPEARDMTWSSLYGRPYQDIDRETPLILDDNVIQVRQAPIHMVQDISANERPDSDPWRLVAQVWKRPDIDADWELVPYYGIADFNAYNGTIILEEDLYSDDPRLVEVSYTSSRGVLPLKHDGTNRINLNPYINAKPEWLNKPLYVTLYPEYVMTHRYITLPESVKTRTLRVLEDDSVFDPLQANYNPLAILLGVVYITTNFDLDQLSILDTRKRGGGAKGGFDPGRLNGLQVESESYWDVNMGDVISYPNGGFILVRLPEELKEDENITEQQIIDAVRRNITAGVGFKLEDMDGNKW